MGFIAAVNENQLLAIAIVAATMNDHGFRPAFSNNVQQYTGLPQDSIAAYLQRSLVSGDEFILFDALKLDACTKYAAAEATLSRGISSFRQAFEQRFEVDRSE